MCVYVCLLKLVYIDYEVAYAVGVFFYAALVSGKMRRVEMNPDL